MFRHGRDGSVEACVGDRVCGGRSSARRRDRGHCCVVGKQGCAVLTFDDEAPKHFIYILKYVTRQKLQTGRCIFCVFLHKDN